MRGKQAPKRDIRPDHKFGSSSVTRLISYIMKDGKRTIAEKIVYECLDIIKENTKKEGIEIFEGALKNVAPQIEVKSKRIGGGNYQVPIEVRSSRRESLAFRWILIAARAKKGKDMSERLAFELIEAFNNRGDAIKKKEDVYKMAQANRAFAHFVR